MGIDSTSHQTTWVLLFALALLLAFGSGWWLGRRRPLGSTPAASQPPPDLSARQIAEVAAAERERIHADLHDDLGARLLELIYAAPDQASADRARAVLQDLRDVVSRSRSEPGTLRDVLESIRGEAAQRLQAVGAELNWQTADDLPDPALDAGTALHLHRIVREAISNAIRHARARRLRVRVAVGSARELLLELTDEGGVTAAPLVATDGGTGLQNMRARAEALQGNIDWTPGTQGGTKVLLKAPLPMAAT